MGRAAMVAGLGLLAPRAMPAANATVMPAMTSEQFLVEGEVTARAETEFTVRQPAAGGRIVTIQVSDQTTINRGAASIPLADLRVGEKVSVTVAWQANGRLIAVKVAVRLPEEQS